MKKLLSCLIIAVMSVCAVTCAFAAENSLKVSADGAEFRPGDTVKITVSSEETVNFKSFGLSLDYNKTVFTLVSGSWNFTDAVIADVDIDKSKAAAAFETAVSKSGKIAEFVFRVNGTDMSGDFEIKVTPTVKNGSATVSLGNGTASVKINTDATSSPSGSTEPTVSTPSDTSSTEGNGSSAATPSDTTAAPGTGDSSKSGLWIAIGCCAAVVLAVIIIVSLKKKQEDENK